MAGVAEALWQCVVRVGSMALGVFVIGVLLVDMFGFWVVPDLMSSAWAVVVFVCGNVLVLATFLVTVRLDPEPFWAFLDAVFAAK